MEKRTPHCKLSDVKSLIDAGKVRTTHSARMGANDLGLDFSGMLDVLMALSAADFYKSMTTPPTTPFGKTCIAPERMWAMCISS